MNDSSERCNRYFFFNDRLTITLATYNVQKLVNLLMLTLNIKKKLSSQKKKDALKINKYNLGIDYNVHMGAWS